MIRIESIHIHEFRGIRNLKLDLNGQNFAACGPNGTGKSGIVDAIEFALSGDISRLSGAGTGGLSVKTHGPHVDIRNNPQEAFVTLEVVIPSLKNKKATITRSVKLANNPTITPEDHDVLSAFKAVSMHPEFVLSRRELIRYVLSEPGKRSAYVQTLLRLDIIEKIRGILQRIANGSKRDIVILERAEEDTRKSLMTALDIPTMSKIIALASINDRRAVLGLPHLPELDANTSIKDGLISTKTSEPSKIPKAQALLDVASMKRELSVFQTQQFQQICADAIAKGSNLIADQQSLEGITHIAFLNSALEADKGTFCPVCDTAFEEGELRRHIEAKIARLSHLSNQKDSLETSLKPILSQLSATGISLNTIIEYSELLKPKVDASQIVALRNNLRMCYQRILKLLPLEELIESLNELGNIENNTTAIDTLASAMDALPEPSKQEAARDFLVLAQERLDKYTAAKRAVQTGKFQSERATKVFQIYAKVTTEALERIYKMVETAFSDYYRKINEDDENGFTAKLIPSSGKLGFDVDFYGRGHFPPGAYHSEGHQDGMGLCLYLALMNHLQDSNFTFAVFDDVLMSVDSGHRRQVCKLLKEQFANTQFVFTTHDDIWLKHMKSQGLIKSKNFAHFRTWSVDLGPSQWDSLDIWDELEEHLEKNDVRAAAALLRHYLEHFAAEVCERLRAVVEFQGDAQFELGELLPAATSAFGKFLKRAKDAANSWNNSDILLKISSLEEAFNKAKKETSCEQWQINNAVHYNEWANFSKQDFSPVVEAFRSFVECFSCKLCSEIYYVIPARGPKREGLRCGCGDLNLNLNVRS